MGTQTSISNDDLPALFRAADTASVIAQRSYMRLVRLNLCLVVASAVVSSLAVSSPNLRVLLAVSGAVALFGGLALTVFVLQTEPNKQWFGARAVAESVKTVAWRYMMVAEPYGSALTDQDADQLFCRELDGILRERRAIGGSLGGPEASAEQITGRMRQVRRLELPLRKDIYIQSRIMDQRSWYASKASANARSSRRWIGVVSLTQLAGAFAALALVRWPDLEFNLAAVLASAAAALMAWLQVKQHQELAHSYGLAAHELGLIETRAAHVHSENDFSSFVADAETAISREHTMWVARRDVVA